MMSTGENKAKLKNARSRYLLFRDGELCGSDLEEITSAVSNHAIIDKFVHEFI